MSMLTSQVDRLRLMARLARDYDPSEVSRMLREAADTIEALRGRLQEAVEPGGTLYALETWTDLDDIGQGYVVPRLYRTRERAEAAKWEFEAAEDSVGYHADVLEFEVVG